MDWQFLLVPLVIIVGVAMIIGRYSRSQAILENWARENRLQILSSERRTLLRGPFFLTTSKSQDVYYVTVRTEDGQTRSAYVRCGGWILGMWSDQADARWV